ncbi:glycosyltransferase [Marinobacter sp. MA]|uniref:glycosyltransferase family 2 protein n=1 Tax=Marinobacter sp. MA TaxID=2971606 RepID=UPI003AACEC63
MIQKNIDTFRKLQIDDLPSESEIMKHWHGDRAIPEVSVICNTYNHEEYIEDALKGFLIQKTDFPFEVSIHDDASTDTTATIIEKYQRKYPNIIKSIIQAENQRSKGMRPTLLNFPNTKGRLIAMCEGDDFWFGSNKLQQQKELLDKTPDVDLCTHPVAKINTDGRILSTILGKQKKKLINASRAIKGGGGWCATSSLMVRREIIDKFANQFQHVPVGDLVIKCLGSARGGAVFLNENCSVYRVGVLGSWSAARGREGRLLNYHRRMQSCLTELGKLEEFSNFNDEINFLRSKFTYSASVDYLRLKDYKMSARLIANSFRLKPFLSFRQVLLGILLMPFLMLR